MIRLIGLELRRALARRLVRLLGAAVVISILIAGVSVFFAHEAASEADLRARVRERDVQQTACIRGEIYPPDESVRIDHSGGGFFGEAPPLGTPDREGFCRFAAQLFAEHDPRFRLDQVRDALTGTITPLVLIALILAASLIGGEWRANTVAVQLTWEPRRLRLFAAKAAAAVMVGASFFFLAQVLLGGALAPSVAFRGTSAGLDAEWWRGTAGLVGRGTAMAALSGAIGFALATVGRNTTAALGIMFGYIALLEGALLGNIWPGIRSWLLLGNSIVFASGNDNLDIVGRSPTEAGVLLAVYASAALILSAAWFARRDVT